MLTTVRCEVSRWQPWAVFTACCCHGQLLASGVQSEPCATTFRWRNPCLCPGSSWYRSSLTQTGFPCVTEAENTLKEGIKLP